MKPEQLDNTLTILEERYNSLRQIQTEWKKTVFWVGGWMFIFGMIIGYLI